MLKETYILYKTDNLRYMLNGKEKSSDEMLIARNGTNITNQRFKLI
jgi:hypothetical protein